ncbi:MAG: glycoside hydrolase family 88 protein, partial [Acidobacteriota bacterium]|nr:glycoside hydrolase family 88 protein [Acidobacteriota bacterium]
MNNRYSFALLFLVIIPVFLFASVIPVGAQTFNFSLSAYGPHSVVQGHDSYIRVSGKTLSGTSASTSLSVQNVPAGTSDSWPDGSSFGTADFNSALRIRAGSTTPQGSYAIQITAVSNGVTRQIAYNFSVIAPPAPTIPPVINSMPAIPNLSDWQSHMTTKGQQTCNYLDTPGLTFDDKLSWVYYDQIRVMYQISDYMTASSSTWNACALKARGVYRDSYVIPNNGGVPGYWNFSTGLRMDYERTGDAQSKNAALLLSEQASYARDSTPLESLIDTSRSRETAYAILAKLDAEKLGSAPSARLVPLVDIALGHMDQWFVSKTSRCPNPCDPAAAVGQYYLQPFMFGLTMRALIVYYEKTGDPRIPAIIKTAADWLWANAWVAADRAFWYENWVSDPAQLFPARAGSPDLNLLIAPAYAWLYRQTGNATYQSEGDQIFSGGVLGAYLDGGKQFDQNYIWSFDYIKWRTASASSSGVNWIQPVNVVVNGSSLTKNAGCADNCRDAGAVTQQQI